MASRKVWVVAVMAAFLAISGRVTSASEVTDLEAKLGALEDQMDQEKDKTKKEDLKNQEKALKQQLKAAKVAEKAKEADKEKADKGKTAAAGAKKSEARGLNKFSRFWTEEVGKPMRKFFHGS